MLQICAWGCKNLSNLGLLGLANSTQAPKLRYISSPALKKDSLVQVNFDEVRFV